MSMKTRRCRILVKSTIRLTQPTWRLLIPVANIRRYLTTWLYKRCRTSPVGGGFFFAGPPSSNWEMLDGYALPLRHICYIANVTAVGTQVIGNNGEILYYNIVNKGTTDNPSYP